MIPQKQKLSHLYEETSAEPYFMKALLNKLPHSKHNRQVVAISITVAISLLLTLATFYGFRDYGSALFIFLPIFMGFSSTVLYGYHRAIRIRDAFLISSLTVLAYCLCLLLFAMEGAICLLMAAPLGFLLSWLGAMFGHAAVTHKPNKSSTGLLLLIVAIPTVSFIEKQADPALRAVVTSVEIDADAQAVWENVIAFPQLNEPDELLFKAGIAYPVNAQIQGNGVGAVRHCNFNTGSFVEPITVWEEAKRLQFNVVKQPEPMKEISIWNIHPPHLHDMFISKKGQFRLIKLPNGKIRLEGTTWYTHNLRPAFYWQLWSDYIVHKIHKRVLLHIKANAEAATKSKAALSDSL